MLYESMQTVHLDIYVTVVYKNYKENEPTSFPENYVILCNYCAILYNL